jgi:hypothetical protein
MRPQDKTIFAAAAASPGIKSWILVRRTNPKSLKYIGVAGFTPKRIDCKAKTADQGQLAGLVVSPEFRPDAFSDGRREKVLRTWRGFTEEVLDLPQSPYSVDIKQNSEYYGCVLLNNCRIHGDYDLYDVIDPLQAQRNLAAIETLLGQPHRRGPKFFAVQDFVNNRIGVPMVQHGGEAQYTDYSEQSIDAFGPDHEQCTILNEFSVRGWYRTRFQGRRTLG